MDYTATKARRTYGSFEIGNARNARRGLSGQILEEKSRLTKLNTADAPRLLSPRLFSYALLQVKTTGIAAQHDGNPLILPILGRQNPENKNNLENFLKSLKKRLTKQQIRQFLYISYIFLSSAAETAKNFSAFEIFSAFWQSPP